MKVKIKQIEYNVFFKKRVKLNWINRKKFIASVNHAQIK